MTSGPGTCLYATVKKVRVDAVTSTELTFSSRSSANKYESFTVALGEILVAPPTDAPLPVDLSPGAVGYLYLSKDGWKTTAKSGATLYKASIGLSGPYVFYPFTSRRAIDAMSQWPDPQATQPLHFARADAPPLFLATSSADDTVRPKNAINLAAKLRRLGAPVELRNYEGLSHEDVVMALSKPFRGKAPVLADALAFLNTHNGPASGGDTDR